MIFPKTDQLVPSHLGGLLKVVKYHGKKRGKHANDLVGSDIVLTTYYTLAVDFARGYSTLHETAWFRIALDEGKKTNRMYTTL